MHMKHILVVGVCLQCFLSCAMRMHLAAGQACRDPHIVLHGETRKLQQFPMTGKSSDKVDALVFINQVSANQVIPLSTSSYPGFKVAEGIKKSSKECKHGLDGQEMSDILLHVSKAAMKKTGVQKGRKPLLIMDRHPAHRSSLFKDACKANGIELMLMPPGSPDLSPLDSHLFGVVKNAVHRDHPQERPWAERSKAFIRQLELADAARHIESWKHKIEKCVQANGWHFKE